MEDKQFSQININMLGEQLKLRVDDGGEHALKVSARMRAEVNKLMVSYPSMSTKQLAVFAAFNITEQLVDAEDQLNTLKELLDK